MKKTFITLTALCCAACTVAFPVSAAETTPEIETIVENAGYSYSVDGDNFDFYDFQHSISILGGTLKDGKDISYYGLNDDGNLAIVYFNVTADEGMGAVLTNDSMAYITYAGGEISEFTRDIGTTSLFGFDMSLADPSLPGMMKVFNASLGGFLQAYGAEIGDYSTISSDGALSGAISYVKGSRMDLLLIDDNFITNKSDSANKAFLANEWGIYSGFQVVDGVDYNSFCFFGDASDVYYFGYARTASGFQILNMKGTVSRIDDRTQYVSLTPVDMSKCSDSASQYITKMASSLMGAQGYPSVNLDTLSIMPVVICQKGRLSCALYAYTTTASGLLYYSSGAYTGTITDEDGNSETLSVTIGRKGYVVTSKTSGVFTVARNCLSFGSLLNARPKAVSRPCYGWGFWWF